MEVFTWIVFWSCTIVLCGVWVGALGLVASFGLYVRFDDGQMGFLDFVRSDSSKRGIKITARITLLALAAFGFYTSFFMKSDLTPVTGLAFAAAYVYYARG
jgi:hypothetical protein